MLLFYYIIIKFIDFLIRDNFDSLFSFCCNTLGAERSYFMLILTSILLRIEVNSRINFNLSMSVSD